MFLQYLRYIGLTGTKLGCGEGGCGACTVMLSYYDHTIGTPRHFSANACLTPLCALDGYHVTTVEGISGAGGLHPVQQRIAELHGSQCGFCTPGIVMSLYTILRSRPNSTPHEIEESLDGNLCRCTGYRPIIDAARSLSNNKPAGSGCCQGKGGEGGCPCKDAPDLLVMTSSEDTLQAYKGLTESMHSKGQSEPIFPPALTHYTPSPFQVQGHKVTWFQPTSLEELLQYKAEHPEAKLVVGNTEVGIEVKFKAMEYMYFTNPNHVAELKVLELQPGGLLVGSAVTLQTMRDFIEELEGQAAAGAAGGSVTLEQIRGLVAMKHMLTWFASTQIRNVASLGGNIATASPISDMNPMLCSCGAVLRLVSSTGGVREVPISEFFLSYRRVDMQPSEILQNVFIPFTSRFEFVVPLKQAKRREDDISIVTSGMRVALEPSPDSAGWRIADCSLAFGGMAPTTIVAKQTCAFLTGQAWNAKTLTAGCAKLQQELQLPDAVPGGQPQYRQALCGSFLWRTFLKVSMDLGAQLAASSDSFPPAPVVPAEEQSAAEGFVTLPKAESRGEQSFFDRQGGLQQTQPAPHTPAGDEATPRAPVGQCIPHKSSSLQVTGQAVYTDDIPSPRGTLHGALVMSNRAHAIITNIDTSAAEACPGFERFFSYKDVPGSNSLGAVIHDEEVFVEKEVKHVGAIIGLVVATTHEEAVYAARKVVVSYEDLPAVISIQAAIREKSFFPNKFEIESGSLQEQESEADFIVEGDVNIGGQEHFYLETNCAFVQPIENRQLEITSSTQNATETQMHCASACGLPASHVMSKVKRIGGGFGGKESRAAQFACPIAIAAHLMQVPVRINVERDTDMSVSGQRHAFYGKYRAGCTKSGKLKFLDLHMYNNAGYSLDLSAAVLGRAMFHCDGPYHWPALRTRGTMCRTNQPSNTAFRGFGGPQGMLMCETVLEHLATQAGLSAQTMRDMNLYTEGQHTHYGQPIEAFNVPIAWRQVLEEAKVAERQAAIEKFNKENKWKKRGLCVLPTKYGLNYTAKFMNQGGALVNVYTDGTVLVSHGGMEMGQGLHTKVIQITARALGIAHELVHVSETNTSNVPNAIATAGSMGTDLYGMAVLDACEQLNARLQPVRESMAATSTWPEVVTSAYFQRVNLSAQGFYTVPTERCGYDWNMPLEGTSAEENAKRGHPFNYFTQGAACTEVEVDCLTVRCTLCRPLARLSFHAS